MRSLITKVIVKEKIMEEVASQFSSAAQEAIRLRGFFNVAISGGHTPALLYEILAKENLPWSCIRVFWTDERNVPRKDSESNYRLAFDLWLQHVPIPAEQIFAFRTELKDPKAIADDYENTLRENFKLTGKDTPVFDLVLLGVGTDGHTASLFNIDNEESDRSVLYPWVEKIQAYRYTLAPRVLNHARKIFVLVTGEDKSKIVASILLGNDYELKYPIEMMAPAEEKTTWFLDSNSATDYLDLAKDKFQKINSYWRACNYLSVGMLYLKENPLLKKPLEVSQIKKRLLGHWGTSPGQSFIWVHLNRLITKFDLNMIFISGPGHGAPATLSNAYLEGTYSEIYPGISEDEEGLLKFFRQFSFPGGIGSHCTPETPGSIHEGGELGYSLSHAFGAVFDNPDLIATVVVGDGEAETGPLATAWHSNKFLNPIVDGAVLPILHLNGYKIANPTLLARISPEELEKLFEGYGWTPYVVDGDDPFFMHQKMAETLELCLQQIRDIQITARTSGQAERPRWPLLILKSPKGWSGPQELDGHKVEGSWRSHQVPILDVATNPTHLRILEEWMRNYEPQKLFDEKGKLIAELKELAPKGNRRMSANPHANGGTLRKDLRLPEVRNFSVAIPKPGIVEISPTAVLSHFLAEIMRMNMKTFRVFGPDETASNRLEAIYQASKKTWLADLKPEDEDGGELSPDGRVMEMLSEHTLEGWLEGYLLTGRHGLLATYESFVHVIDSMINQHAKWLEKSKLSWRAPISSLNLLITSLVWRQDHNGFTHQDPGLLDIVTNKSAEVVRIYLPPDANCLLNVVDHCLRSKDFINVIVADKQPHLQFLDMETAVLHCNKGIGIWNWACSDREEEPDVVMACAGDIVTTESLAAVAILRERLPLLKIRFINVVDLFKLERDTEHPHGLTHPEFDALFTKDRPVIFNFHGYPSLIHRLTYKRTNHQNIHVRGYKEKGNINTPLELAILNQVDRFNLVIDVINRVPHTGTAGVHVREWAQSQIKEAIQYAHEEGVDREEIRNWKWPFP